LFLQQFAFQIEHCSGRANVIADADENWSSNIIVAALNWKGFDKELLKKLKHINNEQKAEAELALIIQKCQEKTLRIK
jgi:hypothetical protein